jgi:hypothetical protein
MEPRRFPTRTQTIVAPSPAPDFPDREDVITIDLSVEASAALGPERDPHILGELPDDLCGMYYTG